jgi:hypothetical protein
MRHFRAILSVGAFGAAFVLVAPGCQVITGTYTVDSIGPACTSLAACCVFLPTGQNTTCLSVVSSEQESLCAELRVNLPVTACMPQTSDAGITFPDAQVHHDGTLPPGDAVVPHDAPGGGLEGTWTLASITCLGQPISMGDITTTITFSPGDVKEVETFSSDGCVETIDLGDCAITSTTITSPSGSTACSTSCNAADGCTVGTAPSNVLPYTLSGGTLSLSESNSTSCSSGTIEFNFQMN